MARYIDADKMREEWLEYGENEYVYDTNAVVDSIDAQPTADVAPRIEVAREIFEEIDSLFEKFYNDPLYSCGELGYDIEELKQKYTEEQK